VALPGLGKLVWPGAILAGMALGGFVLLSWPDSTTRVVRLPYGESSPKTPREGTETTRVAVVSTGTAAAAPAPAQGSPHHQSAPPHQEPSRVLAAAEREAAFAGPDPIPSQLELEPGYSQESPEALGAEPLPGAELTPAQPPVAR
jgi:hypothetical protein